MPGNGYALAGELMVEASSRNGTPTNPDVGPRVLDWSALMAIPPEPPPELRRGVPEIGVTVLAGSPKVGKTLWASQTALETGRRALLVIEEGSLAGIAYRLT